MGEELPNPAAVDGTLAQMEGGGSAATAEQWLLRARKLLPTAMQRARGAKGYPSRWKAVVSKLERVPVCISDLSSHPFFSRNAICLEQLQCVCHTLLEATELAARCADEDTLKHLGKLQMQSDLDAVIGKLDMNLRDCGLLVKTGVLGSSSSSAGPSRAEQEGVRELLARLQIGDVEARHRAVDGLLEVMKEDEKSVLGALGRGNVAALIQLLSATSAKVKEKAANAISQLVQSGNCEGLLVSEGVLPPLIRLAESGSPATRENAVASLQRLSASPKIARSIAGHGGIRPLIELCTVCDHGSVCQAAAAGVLKNLSSVPEIRLDLAEEGAVKVAIDLLDRGLAPASKEYAAQCLQNLTASDESLRRAVVAEGGVRCLLAYVDGPAPHEPAVAALRNLVGCVPAEGLVRMRLLPRLVRVMKVGSAGAQQAAASVICKISSCSEMKKLVGESGCLPLLVRMLESKPSNARGAAAQAIASLVSHRQNARELRKDDKGVPNLVQLLDPNPLNTAKKYAVTCLLALSSSRRCRRLMISHGAIGYLKKLGEMEVPGARKLLERLDRGRLRSLFRSK